MATSYIYVIGKEDQSQPCVKIGFSATPQKRLQNLQVSCVDILQIFHLVEVDDKKARIMEGIIHDANRHRKLRGEWYQLTAEEAQAEVDWAFIRFEDNPIFNRK